MKKYEDYKKAIADGYVQANPTVDQPQFHFTNDANAKYADTVFDPTRPTSLLYYRTTQKRFVLEGVMFTARPSASEDELNRRIPLAWHAGTSTPTSAEPRPEQGKGILWRAPGSSACSGSIHTRSACGVLKAEPFSQRFLRG